MGSYLESLVRQFDGSYLFLIIDQHVVNAIAAFTNEMLMPFDQRIEMLRTATHQYLQLFVSDQFLKITIDGSKAHVGQTFTHFIVNLVRSRMGIIVFDRLPHNFQLFGISWLLIYLRHGYAVRSSTKDCRVSGSMTALAW